MIFIFILFNLAVIGNALMRAFDFSQRKVLGHFFEGIMIASFLGIIILAGLGVYQPKVWGDLVNLIMMYLFIRAGIFNPLWGHFALKWWWYLGHTNLYDRILEYPADKWHWSKKQYLKIYYIIMYFLGLGCLTNGFLL